MVFASTCKHASSAFLFESSSSDQIFLASSLQFKKYKYRWRALRKFSTRSLYLVKKRFAPSYLDDTVQPIPAAYTVNCALLAMISNCVR